MSQKLNSTKAGRSNVFNDNLSTLLELQGLQKIIKSYTKPNIEVLYKTTDINEIKSQHMFKLSNLSLCQYSKSARFIQFYIDVKEDIEIIKFYGNVILYNPAYLFNRSEIKTFTVKGIISLVGNSNSMFAGAMFFNSDLSKWDVSQVTTMNSMFTGTYIFNSRLDEWDTFNVTNMYMMFAGTSCFTSDLSRWDVSKVTNMSEMFFNARSFTSDLSRWDVSKVKNMSYMFSSAISFNSNLFGWNISSSTDTNFMFRNASSFNSYMKDSKKELSVH